MISESRATRGITTGEIHCSGPNHFSKVGPRGWIRSGSRHSFHHLGCTTHASRHSTRSLYPLVSTNRSDAVKRSKIGSPRVWMPQTEPEMKAHRLPCSLLISIKPLFQKRIPIHVIAVLLPEARNVVLCELQSSHPLH